MKMKGLRALRERKGWNQKELAMQIGVSTSSVGMYEQGRRTAPVGLLIKIAKLFGCKIEDVLGVSELPKGLKNKISCLSNTNQTSNSQKEKIILTLLEGMDFSEISDLLSKIYYLCKNNSIYKGEG